jgi:mitogen-activated protein kinase organizer 1
MRVAEAKAPERLPSAPVARLVGHDGPIQAIRFTGMSIVSSSSSTHDDDDDDDDDCIFIFLTHMMIRDSSFVSSCNTADGKYCFTGGVDRTVRLWNPNRLDPMFPPPPVSSYSHDDTTTSSDDIPMEHLPRALPIQVYTDGFTHPISAVAVDEASLVCASDKTIVISDVVTRQTKRRFPGHTGRVNAVALSHDTFLSASYDATVRIWDAKSRSVIQILKDAKDSVTDLHVAEDALCIRTASVDGCVRTYDLRKGEVACDEFASPITSMAPCKDGSSLAVSCLDGSIRLMDIGSGQLLNTYESHHVAGRYGLHCCITADDATVVTGSEDGRAVLYDLVSATCVQSLVGHSRPTCAVATQPTDSSVVVTASFDEQCVVWANSADAMRW